MNLVDKYLIDGKTKRKIKIELEKDILKQKKAFRIPTTGAGQTFKDKKKYNRKEKHKTKYI
jgi:hypothetical protein